MDAIGRKHIPRVSVIVPNYNHAPFLKQRIESILNQTYQDFELILLDDCSTDNSLEILQDYQDNPYVSHILFNKENSGSPFAQWNKGIELAKGEWIWIAESDDWADTNFLEEMIKAVDLNTQVGLAFAKANYVQKNHLLWEKSVTNDTYYYSGMDFIKSCLLFDNVIYNVSMVLFRKDVYNKIDHTRYSKMRLCGDWWFYTLLSEHCDVLEVDKLLTYYQIHDSNTSSEAEHLGKSFTEGLDVLDYIVKKYGISKKAYSRYWGRKWVKYRKKYDYPNNINQCIKNRIVHTYRRIYLYYCIYNIKKKCLE